MSKAVPEILVVFMAWLFIKGLCLPFKVFLTALDVMDVVVCGVVDDTVDLIHV